MRGPLALVTTSLIGLSVLVAVGAPVACSMSYPPCYPGEYQGCVCTTGAQSAAHGYQACNVTGDGFGPCVCDGTTPGVDGGRDSGALDASDAQSATDAAAGGQYMMSCNANGACAGAGAICFEFGTKGKVCTKPCTQPTDCPPPSPGCSTQSLCRAP